MTVRWEQGRIHPGPQETPEDGRHGAPAALSWGQAAFSSGLGGIQGSEPEVRVTKEEGEEGYEQWVVAVTIMLW